MHHVVFSVGTLFLIWKACIHFMVVEISKLTLSEFYEMLKVLRESPLQDFSSKCDQIHNLLRVWSHLLKKSIIENFILLQWSGFKNISITAFSRLKVLNCGTLVKKICSRQNKPFQMQPLEVLFKKICS